MSFSKSNHGNYLGGGASLSTLFQVTFPEDHEIATVHEFERADPSIKGELWYFAKELKMLLAQEVDRNRKYAQGELSQDEIEEMSATTGETDPEELCCWRGLEHVWEDEDRSAKIRNVVGGIVGWFQDSTAMGYHDPDELRIVSKARTKADRSKAQKRGGQDASYVKKLRDPSYKDDPDKQSSAYSPKRMAKRLSGKLTSMPKLNSSPKPKKKTVAAA